MTRTQRTSMEDSLSKLALESQVNFDIGAHEQLLVDLWSVAFPTDLYERTCTKWHALGFQGDDPVRDLRGAGHLALRHLKTFAATVGLRSFLAERASSFPLALASFTVTAMLCRYFRLNPTLIFPGCADHSATDPVQRHFLELHAQHAATSGVDVLQWLHARLLLQLARKWDEMQTASTTIMEFHLALRWTYAHLHRALTITPRPWTISSMSESIDAGEALEARWAMMECNALTLYTLVLAVVARLTCADSCCTAAAVPRAK